MTEEAGEMQHVGVDVLELVRSQCSSSRSISAEVGPPDSAAASEAAAADELPMALSPFLAKNSSAVVRSHIWTAPEECPVMTNRLGLMIIFGKMTI